MSTSQINGINRGGIVPPWLETNMEAKPTKPRNPGIVPPWLAKPVEPKSKNPGIVPPWLLDVPHILPIGGSAEVATDFVREPTTVSPPMSMVDAVRRAHA